jgi:predicted DNA-binding protein
MRPCISLFNFTIEYLNTARSYMLVALKSIEVTKPSTTCATFRLPSEKLNKLRKVSEAKNVTPNTLVNQIIKAHLDWHSRAAHAKLYYLPKSFLIRLLNELDEEELNELARDTAKNDLVDISLFLRGGFTISSLSNITETWLRLAQMPYRYEIIKDGCKIIIEHDMGIKYSQLIKEISRYLLEVAFETKSFCDITENAVIIKLQQ